MSSLQYRIYVFCPIFAIPCKLSGLIVAKTSFLLFYFPAPLLEHKQVIIEQFFVSPLYGMQFFFWFDLASHTGR